MASQFQVQKPYVLTTLPRPLDPITGTYVVGEVYGYAPGSKKRKRRRAELTVGIDGEAINIYDVSSSKLVTSYPIPPQSSLSCPVSSIRLKSELRSDVSRYTYVASDESRINRVTLFKDTVGESGKTDQVTCSTSLGPGHATVWIAPTLNPVASDNVADAVAEIELLTIRANGEITCLNGESLERKWTSTATVMIQDLPDDASINFTIDFCRSILASEVAKGIFKGNNDVFSLLFSSGQAPSEQMEVLVLISNSGSVEHRNRHLHIIGRLPSTLSSAHSGTGVVQLHVMPILPLNERQDGPTSYSLDTRNGALLELYRHTLIIHDLTTAVPKIMSTMELDGTNSFWPLSRTSLLCATNTQVSVFNPVYRSLQNSVEIDLASQGQTDIRNSEEPDACQLVAYFSPLERAVAIVGSNLVAIQLEAPKNRHVKRRAEGLLIDSIGRGLPTVRKTSAHSSASIPKHSIFSNYLPGSVRGDYWERWAVDQKKANALLNSNNIAAFETFLAGKFGIKVEASSAPIDDSTDASMKNTLVWRLPKTRANYPKVDRRWILYAISRTFQWNNALHDDSTVPRLILQLPQSNILNYLVDAGHLSLSNLKASFREALVEVETVDSFLGEQLVAQISEIDPSLELLVVYLSATDLGAQEILLVLKVLMKSLELVDAANQSLPKLITNGVADEATNEDDHTDINENVGMELDDLEDEIQRTVCYLNNNEDAGIRGRGLSVAFAKLGASPNSSAVKALKATFTPEELMSLMYVLRIELVKGGWTDRYIDANKDDAPYDAPPDGILSLIADVLGLCIDSLGPSGWVLSSTSQRNDDSTDFIMSLIHEVSAALEGVEETVYLRNILAGPLKFFEDAARKAEKAAAAVQEVTAAIATTTTKPIAIRIKEPVAAALPLDLKPSQHVSAHKVVSGGEVVQRSAREKGHLISQKVGSYSLERIII